MFKEIIHYCCGKYPEFYGGLARYDYQVKLAFPNRKFFLSPYQKIKMLTYLKKCEKPIVITDNHLSIDIPNEYPVILVHHGCAKTTATRNPDWAEPWKSLCCDGQNKMLDYRDPKKTIIISISQSCTDDFTKYYGDKYKKFKRIDLLHPSELNESVFRKNFNRLPIILGNWTHVKKGKKSIINIVKSTRWAIFQQLNVRCKNGDINDFNKRKQDIYCNCDMFLQLSTSEGNSYATLDALMCGLVVISSNVGLFYKDVPEDCFVKLDWKKMNNINYVKEKIKYGWDNRESISKKAREWYMKNCRLVDWKNKMHKLVEDFYKEQYLE